MSIRETRRAHYLRHREQIRAYQKRYYEANKAYVLDRQRHNAYGVNADTYAALLLTQQGLCAICGQADPTRQLSVDHNHLTGTVRGLLCNNCNRGIGFLGDTAAGVERALQYLRAAEESDISVGTAQ